MDDLEKLRELNVIKKDPPKLIHNVASKKILLDEEDQQY